MFLGLCGLVLVVWYLIEKFDWIEISANAFTELLGIFVTVFIIDKMNDIRAKEELKEQIIREMGNRNNSIVLRAIREAVGHGWLTNGAFRGKWFEFSNMNYGELHNADLQGTELNYSKFKKAQLYKANLSNAHMQGANFQDAWMPFINLQNTWLKDANLQNANLMEADLFNAHIEDANLQNANVTDEQLSKVETLKGTIMPSGVIYNGRFNFDYDIININIMIKNHALDSPADYYKVPKEVYERGQKWKESSDNLPIFSQETEEWTLIKENPDGQDLYD